MVVFVGIYWGIVVGVSLFLLGAFCLDAKNANVR